MPTKIMLPTTTPTISPMLLLLESSSLSIEESLYWAATVELIMVSPPTDPVEGAESVKASASASVSALTEP